MISHNLKKENLYADSLVHQHRRNIHGVEVRVRAKGKQTRCQCMPNNSRKNIFLPVFDYTVLLSNISHKNKVLLLLFFSSLIKQY